MKLKQMNTELCYYRINYDIIVDSYTRYVHFNDSRVRIS